MREGILEQSVLGGKQTITATISPDGWVCSVPWMKTILDVRFPIPPTEAGEPFVIAFYQAIDALDAEVIQAPEGDPFPPDEDGPTDNVFCPTGPGGGVDPTCSPGGAGNYTQEGTPPPAKWDSDLDIMVHSTRMLNYYDNDEHNAKLKDRIAAIEAEIPNLKQQLKDAKDYNALMDANARIKAARKELADGQEAMAHNSRRAMLLHFGIPLKDQPRFDADTGPSTSHATQNWEKARDYLKEISKGDEEGIGRHFITVRATNKRAYYDYGTIYTAKEDDAGVSAHEFGHHLESRNEWVKDRVQSFRSARYDPRDDEPMRKYSTGYTTSEVGNPDKMGDTFKRSDLAAYSGKQYPDRTTEIVSMGIEQLYRDPVHLARVNPEYFALIVGILQRGPKS